MAEVRTAYNYRTFTHTENVPKYAYNYIMCYSLHFYFFCDHIFSGLLFFLPFFIHHGGHITYEKK